MLVGIGDAARASCFRPIARRNGSAWRLSLRIPFDMECRDGTHQHSCHRSVREQFYTDRIEQLAHAWIARSFTSSPPTRAARLPLTPQRAERPALGLIRREEDSDARFSVTRDVHRRCISRPSGGILDKLAGRANRPLSRATCVPGLLFWSARCRLANRCCAAGLAIARTSRAIGQVARCLKSGVRVARCRVFSNRTIANPTNRPHV
jgi:hypothetical protein